MRGLAVKAYRHPSNAARGRRVEPRLHRQLPRSAPQCAGRPGSHGPPAAYGDP
jgi:hypothetical protein